VRLRGEWTTEDDAKKGVNIIVTSIPYGVSADARREDRRGHPLQEAAGPARRARRVDDVMRVVLELKKGADPSW
jgi:DNA gyrase/topoisomerase IV subunit A